MKHPDKITNIGDLNESEFNRWCASNSNQQ